MNKKLVFVLVTTSAGAVVGFFIFKNLTFSNKKKLLKWKKLHREQLLFSIKLIITKEILLPFYLLLLQNQNYLLVKLKKFFLVLVVIFPVSRLSFIIKFSIKFFSEGAEKFLYLFKEFFASFNLSSLPSDFLSPRFVLLSVKSYFQSSPSYIFFFIAQCCYTAAIILDVFLLVVLLVVTEIFQTLLKMYFLLIKQNFVKKEEKDRIARELKLLYATNKALNIKNFKSLNYFIVEDKVSTTRIVMASISWVYFWAGLFTKLKLQ